MTEPVPAQRSWWLLYFKLAVIVVVCVAVSGTLRSGWAQLAEHDWQWNLPWLAAAGLLYLAGLVPMAWFWRRVLAALGQRPSWFTTLNAYFLGHLGKYVPGKALVVVIRVGVIRRSVTSIRLAVASVLVETLTLMAVGGVLAAALSVIALNLDTRLTLLALAMAVVAGLPTLPPIARRLAGRAAASPTTDDNQESTSATTTVETDAAVMRRGVTLPLLATGWFAATICWTLLGLSLWATLYGMGVEGIDPLEDLPRMVATVSLAVVAGFLSLLPGGIVVRDALLVELLAPACGDANALVAAVLLRIIWLLSELGICGILRVVRTRHA